MQNQLAVYMPDQDKVKEYGHHIRALLPGGNRLTDGEAYLLSLLSISLDINPFNGEAHIIKNSQGVTKGSMIGIKGLRKIARRQTDYWGMGKNGGYERVTEPEILSDLGYTPGSVAYKLTLVDSRTLSAWTKRVGALMKELGIPVADATAIVGTCPTWIGYGIYKKGEATLMNPHSVAMYRAERDALRRMTDVEYLASQRNIRLTWDDTEVLDAEIEGELLEPEDIADNEIEPELLSQPPAPTTPEKRPAYQIIEELGYDVSEDQNEEKTSPDPEILKNDDDTGYPNFSAMTLEEAEQVSGSDGKKYGERTTAQLAGVANALMRKLQGNLEEAEEFNARYKLAASRKILSHRAGEAAAGAK